AARKHYWGLSRSTEPQWQMAAATEGDRAFTRSCRRALGHINAETPIERDPARRKDARIEGRYARGPGARRYPQWLWNCSQAAQSGCSRPVITVHVSSRKGASRRFSLQAPADHFDVSRKRDRGLFDVLRAEPRRRVSTLGVACWADPKRGQAR